MAANISSARWSPYLHSTIRWNWRKICWNMGSGGGMEKVTVEITFSSVSRLSSGNLCKTNQNKWTVSFPCAPRGQRKKRTITGQPADKNEWHKGWKISLSSIGRVFHMIYSRMIYCGFVEGIECLCSLPMWCVGFYSKCYKGIEATNVWYGIGLGLRIHGWESIWYQFR